jgi:hypothetical protein
MSAVFLPQRDSSDEHVRHTDHSADSLEVGVNSAGQARRGAIKWQDLRRLERSFELRHSVFASHAAKPIHDLSDRHRRSREATLLR